MREIPLAGLRHELECRLDTVSVKSGGMYGGG